MKALVQDEYGEPEVLKIVDMPVPVPGEGEVLVRVHACSINEWDNGLMRGAGLVNRIGGLRRPKRRVIGSDIAGVVEAVGASSSWSVGDEVFGDLSSSGFGAFAQYACVPESALTKKPASLSFEQAATVPQAGGLAVASLRTAGVGKHLLMNGGGGGVGTFAIQIAKARGLSITGVDGPDKQEVMRRLGADHTIDFTREDFTRSGVEYDLVVDVVCQRSLGEYRRALAPGGVCAVVGGRNRRLATVALLGQTLRVSQGRRVNLVVYRANRADDMAMLLGLIEKGDVVPVIDRTFTLDEGAAAMAHYCSGNFAGKIVITIGAA